MVLIVSSDFFCRSNLLEYWILMHVWGVDLAVLFSLGCLELTLKLLGFRV